MEFLPEPYVPEVWEHPRVPGLVIAAGANSLWMKLPMAFGNYRLVGVPLTPKGIEQDYCPLWGWCYRGELALVTAAAVWDPVTEDEPIGWHKRAGEPREAVDREKRPEYNMPRCVHGSYIHSKECSVDEYCEEMRWSMPRQPRVAW